MQSESFTLTMPAGWSGGVVFASPHSGTHYPLDLAQATTLDNLTLRSSEDAFVDQLFAAAPKLGAPLLAATYPRAYVDLNRGPDELDPALIEGVSKRAVNPRVASGLGVIPRVVANGRPIYRGKLKRSDAATRLVQIWHPYHDQLTALMSQARLQAGQALLIDCHSMPHEAIETATRAGTRPDVVLGDRYGAAARGDLVDLVEAALAAAGLSVARNAPFAGAYTAQTYGRPSRGQHVIQIEIDRALYMDEALIAKKPDFQAVQAAVTGMMREVIAYTGRGRSLAAE